jgi:hypothetical protein
VRHIHVRAAVLAFLLFGTTLAYAFSTGPPTSKTNARSVAGVAAETNCTQCHLPTGSQNTDPKGSLHILDVPSQYAPGKTYPLRVQLDYAWDPLPPDSIRWGFEITAVQASNGQGVGLWTPVGGLLATEQIKLGDSITQWASRWYLEHTSAGIHQGENGPVEWTAYWTAPPGDSGLVYFFAAGNAANGDGCSVCGGDHIYTTAESTLGGGVVLAVEGPGSRALATRLAVPYPNPMTQCLDLQFNLSRPGEMDLAIFDLQGRRVRTIFHGYHVAGSDSRFWDGRTDNGVLTPNGVYFARLRAPGLAHPMSHKIIRALPR